MLVAITVNGIEVPQQLMTSSDLDRLLLAVSGSRLARACFECRQWLGPHGSSATGPGEREVQGADNCVSPTACSKGASGNEVDTALD